VWKPSGTVKRRFVTQTQTNAGVQGRRYVTCFHLLLAPNVIVQMCKCANVRYIGVINERKFPDTTVAKNQQITYYTATRVSLETLAEKTS